MPKLTVPIVLQETTALKHCPYESSSINLFSDKVENIMCHIRCGLDALATDQHRTTQLWPRRWAV